MDAHLLYLVLAVVLVLPAGGALSWTLGARWARAGWIAMGASTLAWVGAMLTWLRVATGTGLEVKLCTWLAPGGFQLDVGIAVDALAASMLVLVTTVLAAVHLFAAGTDQAWKGRRAALPNLLVFCLAIVFLAKGYVLLLVGWEGTAACVYVILSSHPAVPARGVYRALVIHRIGATCLLAACVVMLLEGGTAVYPGALTGALTGTLSGASREWVVVLLAVAAASFAGVLPLHLWLSSVEFAPAPSSALLQGAVVPAGLYLLIRSQPLFAEVPDMAALLVVIGLAASLLMALAAVATRDLARGLVCSTASQAGLVAAAIGLGSSAMASSHVFAHSLAKCGLVLAAGMVLQAAPDKGRLDRLGGLSSHLPLAFWTFLIAATSLAGVPPLAPFWSHALLLQASGATLFPGLALGALILLTAMYLARLTILTFMGKSSSTALARPTLPSPAATATALVALAILVPLSVVALAASPADLMLPVAELLHGSATDGSPVDGRPWAAAAGLFAAGALAAWFAFGRRPTQAAEADGGESAARAFLDRAYRLDEVGDLLVARPVLATARALWTLVDTVLVDVLLIRGMPLLVRGLAWAVDWLHQGRWTRGALILVLGAAGGLLGLLLRGM